MSKQNVPLLVSILRNNSPTQVIGRPTHFKVNAWASSSLGTLSAHTVACPCAFELLSFRVSVGVAWHLLQVGYLPVLSSEAETVTLPDERWKSLQTPFMPCLIEGRARRKKTDGIYATTRTYSTRLLPLSGGKQEATTIQLQPLILYTAFTGECTQTTAQPHSHINTQTHRHTAKQTMNT